MADNTKKSLRNLMIYQIFVRNHSDEGTFLGVEKDLDRIRDLGTDIVYLLPIHPIGKEKRKGSLGSPYAISDYRAINTEYGTLEDFKHLVDEIHKRDMKCMMDVVYNHTSPDSVLSEAHPDWFYHREDGSFGNRVGDWTDIIDLDYTNEKLWAYQIETLRFWAEIVDGFRCDVAPLIPISFWERARREVAEVKPGCIWLAESIEKSFITEMRLCSITAHSDGEMYRAFDICYDYDVYDSFKAYFSGESGLNTYLCDINRQEWIYPDNYVKLRFLENHDQTRAAFFVRDEKALRNLTAFSFFQKGIAFVYGGQEFGARHLPGLFDKDTISLCPQEGIDLSEIISRLSKLKKDPIFADSAYCVEEISKDVCLATHKKGGRMALGLFSMKGKEACVRVPVCDGVYKNEIDGRNIEVFHGCISMDGEPVIILLSLN